MNWLGLNWDEEPIKQSERISIHKKQIEKLLEIEQHIDVLLQKVRFLSLEKNKKKVVYLLSMTTGIEILQKEIKEFISQGRSSVIRFKIDEEAEIKWEDQIRGEIKWKGKGSWRRPSLIKKSFRR